MKLSSKEATLLGLNSKELRILNNTGDISLSIAELSRSTNIPRMTLYPILRRLQKRSFLHLAKDGRSTRITSLSPLEVTSLSNSFSLIFSKQLQSQTTLKTEALTCQIFHGLEHIVKEYRSLSHLPTHERLYVVQPNKSAVSVLKKMKLKDIAQICQEFKDNNLIIDAILQEQSINKWVQDVKKFDINEQEMINTLKAFSGRMADTTYIPSEYLNFDSEIWFYRDTLIIFNWREEVVIKIINSEIVGLITHIYLFAKYAGRKADQNAIIEKYFREIGVSK